jgi:hypothetical protein
MDDPNDTALAEQPVSLEETVSAAFDDAVDSNDVVDTGAVNGGDNSYQLPGERQGNQQHQQVQAIEAPQHWPQQDRELFAQQNPQTQQWLLQRHRAMEGDYTRKQQEIAEHRRQYEQQIQFAEQARQIWDPLAQRYARQGISPVQIQQMSAAWVQRLNEDPKAALLELAREFNVDPAQLMEQQDYVDPQTQQLQMLHQNQQRLEQTLQQRDQQQQQERQQYEIRQLAERTQQEVSAGVGEVMNAVDESGNPRFPHFNAVASEVSALMRAVDGSGNALIPFTGDLRQDLAIAYQKAVAMRPDLQQQRGPQPRPRTGDRVRAARLAAQGLSSGSGGHSKPANLEEFVAQAFATHTQ